MGWSFRKSLRLLPGIRLNLSRSGPRLSVGVPGARASIDLLAKPGYMVEWGRFVIRRQRQSEHSRRLLRGMAVVSRHSS